MLAAMIAHGRNLIVLTCNTDLSISSRVAIKKYVQANHKAAAASASFDTQLSKAIRTGVEKGEFEQPKGNSLHCDTHFALALSFPSARYSLLVFVFVFMSSLFVVGQQHRCRWHSQDQS